MTEWKEGYLAALEDAYVAIVARGLWSIALDELIEDLRGDTAEIEPPPDGPPLVELVGTADDDR